MLELLNMFADLLADVTAEDVLCWFLLGSLIWRQMRDAHESGVRLRRAGRKAASEAASQPSDQPPDPPTHPNGC